MIVINFVILILGLQLATLKTYIYVIKYKTVHAFCFRAGILSPPFKKKSTIQKSASITLFSIQ